jgi:hypothetical protein
LGNVKIVENKIGEIDVIVMNAENYTSLHVQIQIYEHGVVY